MRDWKPMPRGLELAESRMLITNNKQENTQVRKRSKVVRCGPHVRPRRLWLLALALALPLALASALALALALALAASLAVGPSFALALAFPLA